MIQTGLIQNAHSDLVTDASYDFYGLRLATCSLDQRIKVWHLDEASGSWSVKDDWKAHDAPVSKLSWAHPEFGSIIASSSFDRSVKVWEQSLPSGQSESSQQTSGSGIGGTSAQPQPSTSRWIERAVLTDARGTVRAVEFAPHHFGLKLATIASDNSLRIYECIEQPSISTWQLSEELDVQNLSSSGSPSLHTHGGWCISWCKDRYWGELIATASGIDGVVKIIQLTPSRRPTVILTLDPTPTPQTSSSSHEGNMPTVEGAVPAPPTFSVTSVSWAPSCGRSYHLIATGSRDGRVRIWRVRPGEDLDREDDDEEGKWTASVVADFDQHKSAIGRVEWNITGTVLSSTGNDGRVRLWKATSGSVWRPAGSIGVEQTEESELQENKDVDMEV
ncbi:Nucleoporin SEH1 [Termitomyces sp. J132]|nr:Nucleoporin SEH1 [Termitomyces sp. J132]